MDLAQIYHIPNWETQDEQQWAMIVARLGASPPYHTKDERGALSGVDCMIRVIQQILRTLDRQVSQRLLREHGSRNFLVDFAIRDFTGDTPIRRENMQTARDSFWGVLCRKTMGTSGTPSFLEVDQSALMQGTLWPDPDLQAFHQSFVRPRGGGGLQTLEKLEETPSDLEEIRTSRSRFTWDTSLHGSLEDMFSAHFREDNVDGAHGTYTLYPRAPRIARILLDPTKARIEGLGISSLYRTSMVTRRMTYRRRDGEEGVSTSVYSADQVTTYSLIAVVRLRKSQHERDYVRLYDPQGHPVVPEGPAEECASHHSREWSVRDQDHQYMLYYAPIAAPPMTIPRPSCAPPPAAASMEKVTDAAKPVGAPEVSKTASEVASRKRQPQPGRKTTRELFDSWAAAYRGHIESRPAGEGWAGRPESPTRAQGQPEPEPPRTDTVARAAASSAQHSSSRPSGSVSLPGGAAPSSSATLPSSTQSQPVLVAAGQDVHAPGQKRGEDADKTRAARSQEREAQRSGQEREDSSASSKTNLSFYSSSFGGSQE